MVTKGQIMTQVHYDKEQRYLAVLKEALRRGEVSRDEAVKALRTMGFSAGTSAIKVKEWKKNKLRALCASVRDKKEISHRGHREIKTTNNDSCNSVLKYPLKSLSLHFIRNYIIIRSIICFI